MKDAAAHEEGVDRLEERIPHKRRGVVAVVVVTLAAVLVAGAIALVSWAPWTPPPVLTPADVQLSAAAGSVSIEWQVDDEGPAVETYVTLRDGVEVGEVGGDETSFQDTGLTPGAEYGYQVTALVETRRSDPTQTIVVQTLTPRPGELKVRARGTGRFHLRWSAPLDSPAPDSYVIFRGDETIEVAPGTATTYTDSEFALGSSHRYQVFAAWDDNVSAPRRSVKVSTFAAPLQQEQLVAVVNTLTPGGDVAVGDRESWWWSFSPKCLADTCPVRIQGTLLGQPFGALLTRDGSAYTGTARAGIIGCTDGTTVKDPTSTLTLRLTAGRTDSDGLWASWRGSLTLSTPRVDIPPVGYCPAQTHEFSLRTR